MGKWSAKLKLASPKGAPIRVKNTWLLNQADQAAFFLGTLAPFLRASDSPIAMACLRLVTLPPLPLLPERSVPFFFLCIALFTVLLAAAPYLRPPAFFLEP